MKKKLIISIVIFVILVNITIVLSIKIDKQDLEYQTIKCTVSNIEKKREHIPFSHIATNKYKVKVWYDNRVYDLKNEDESGWKYKKGDRIDAYYYKDNIYANVQGVKTSTPVAKAYFVFIFIDWGMFTIVIIFYISYRRKKQYVYTGKKINNGYISKDKVNKNEYIENNKNSNYRFENSFELFIKHYLSNKNEKISIENIFNLWPKEGDEKLKYIQFEKCFVVYIRIENRIDKPLGYIYAFDYDGNKLWNLDDFQIVKIIGNWKEIEKDTENNENLIAYNFIGCTVHMDMNNNTIVKTIFTK